jgi:uncharacterized flavoprotein (TIGR03862 family)
MMNDSSCPIIIVGAGPAGLMAAEVLSQAGRRVVMYDAMPSVGRKFLLAGRGGLNLTHAEPMPAFLSRYRPAEPQLQDSIRAFDASAVRAWAEGLGIETFIGSSQRVFPKDMKAAPLLRAWLHRLRAQGVEFHMRARWLGWPQEASTSAPIQSQTQSHLPPGGQWLCFANGQGEHSVLEQRPAQAVLLALGGGSWSRLGSDGAWVPLLQARGVPVASLRPANCGFECDWSAHFKARFAGWPLLSVAASWRDTEGGTQVRRGQFVITESGVEGSLVYAMSADLRAQIEADGEAWMKLDLAPDWPAEKVLAEVARPRAARSWASHLQSRIGLKGVQTGLLRECLTAQQFNHAPDLAAAIKCLPVWLRATRPLDEAISSAGGVTWAALDENWMLHAAPGVFCAGEMLDWEAPTGGYLLTACLASGRAAAAGVLRYLNNPALPADNAGLVA